jgi:hypothetical protein
MEFCNMKKVITIFWLYLGLILTPISEVAHAQIGKEVVSFTAGEVFEIIAYSQLQSPEYSWVLTKDNQLRQASQSPAFSIRLSEAGNYILKGTIISTVDKETVERFFFIRVTEPSVPNTIGEGIQISPPLNERNAIILDESSQLITIKTFSQSSNGYIVDLDTTQDTNNDSIPNNDQYAAGTLFSTTGTPLYVWITNPLQDSIRIQSIDNVHSTQFTVFNQDSYTAYALEQKKNEEQNPAIRITRFSPTQFGFSIDPEGKPWRDEPVLFMWNFGDGKESIHDTPIHSYVASDIKTESTIRVHVRSLTSGEIIETLTTKIQLDALEVATQTGSSVISQSSQSSINTSDASPSSIAIASSTSSTNSEQNNTNSSLGMIIKVLLVILASVFVGFVTVFIIHTLKKIGGVQGMIAKSEEKLLTKEPAQLDVMPLPEVLEPEVVEEAIETSSVVQPSTTPSWLQPSTNETSIETQNTQVVTTTNEQLSSQTTVPSWLQTTDSNVGTTNDSTTTVPSNTGSTPSWLQTTEATTSSKEETTTTVPSWLQTTETPVNTEVQTTATVPSWLQTSEQAVENTVSTQSNTTTIDTIDNSSAQNSPEGVQTEKTEEFVQNTANLPTWLQPTTPSDSNAVSVNSQNQNEILPTGEIKTKSSVVDTVRSSNDNSNTNDTLEIDPKVWATMSEEEKERERKRLKRKRYRANKKQRTTTSSTEDATEAEILPNNSEQEVKNADEIDGQEPAWLQKSLADENVAEANTPSITNIEQSAQAKPNDDIEITIDDSSAIALPNKDTDNHNQTTTPAWLQTGLQEAAVNGQTPSTTPVINDIPLASSSTIPREPDDVQFIVRAEGIDDDKKS